MIERVVPRAASLDARTFRDAFQRPRRPVVLAGAASSWPAVARWSLDGIARAHGDVPVSVRLSNRERPQLFAGDPLAAFDHETLPLARAIDRVLHDEARVAYVQLCELARLPSLARDVVDLPHRGRWLCSPPYVWICGPGTVNPLHYDFNHVLLAQVIGRKRFVLFSPDDSSRLASFVERRVWRTTSLDLGEVDRARFPQLDGATSWTCTVGPGDVLFIPYRWWHYMSTDDPCVSVSWWWEPSLLTHARDVVESAVAEAFKRVARRTRSHATRAR